MTVMDVQLRGNIGPTGPDHIRSQKREFEKGPGEEHGPQKGSFSEALGKEFDRVEGVRFSSHAARRMKDRNIVLSTGDLSRLNKAVQRVEEKGARDSLILLDKTAYIVSVRNRTVVTALHREATLGNVFTNIDSVAIVET